jgi:hypothetical protein
MIVLVFPWLLPHVQSSGKLNIKLPAYQRVELAGFSDDPKITSKS